MRTLCRILLTAAIGLFLSLQVPAPTEAGPNPVVIFETNVGRVIVMLYPRDTPETVKNFLRYVDEGRYDGTVIHRIVHHESFGKNAMSGYVEIPYGIIQGGGFEMGMRRRPVYPPVKHEGSTGLINKKGTIAMARSIDPDSATSQFFFNMIDNPHFDYRVKKEEKRKDIYNTKYGYTAFGKVIRGMDVLEKIYEMETAKFGEHENVPVKPVIIKRAYQPK